MVHFSLFTFPFFHIVWKVSLGNSIILWPSAQGFSPQFINGEGMIFAQ